MFQYKLSTTKLFEFNLNNYTKTIPTPKNHTELVILLHIQIKFHKNYTSEPYDTVAISHYLCQVPSTMNQNTLE